MSENKLSDVIRTSLEKIKELADGETVLGDPITTPNGTLVIPVSKISVGFASGGLDYNGKSKTEERPQNFGGGGGTGLSVVPIAFLIVPLEGEVRLLPITSAAQVGTVDKVTALIERSPEILAKIKYVLSSKKEKKAADDEADSADTQETDTKSEADGQDAQKK